MSAETWGLLPKSQIDDETIEEAINRLIAEHEADPDSHLGAGESLQSHRASEIIDHVIDSVVSDKISSKEVTIQDCFYSLANYFYNDMVQKTDAFAVTIFIEPANYHAYIYTGIYTGESYFYYTSDYLFETLLVVNEHTQYKFRFGIIYPASNATPTQGFGFEILNDVIKGFWVKSTGLAYTANLGVSPLTLYSYRIIYTAATKKMDFYINGVLKATLTDIATPPYNYLGHVLFDLYKDGEATEAGVTILKYIFTRTL